MVLLFIILAMVGMRRYFAKYFLPLNVDGQGSDIHFWLLVFSTVLIVAAGNIINDYFDVRSDRINRPTRIIVVKRLKKRWAIIFHWTLSGIAFLIASYLSWHYQTFDFVITHALSIGILWGYCISWKHHTIFGNIAIGVLVVLVGLVMMEWATADMRTDYLNLWESHEDLFGLPLAIVPIICMEFVFLQVVNREILKDMENVRGDIAMGARTLVIQFGFNFSKRLIAVLAMIFPICYLGLISFVLLSSLSVNWLRAIPFTLIAFINLGISIALLQKRYIVMPSNIKLIVELSIVLIIIYFFIG